MATATTNISIRMDKGLKKQADTLFSDLGMNLSTAFNIFVRECVRVDGIPFRVSRSKKFNEETIAAMLEAERLAHDDSAEKYDSVEEAFASILK